MIAGSNALIAQNDRMILVEDLSLRLYKLDNKDLTFSADLSKEDALGFYLTSTDRFDVLQMCSVNSFTVWQDGKMIHDQSVCLDLSNQEIVLNSLVDTTYFALVTNGSFQGLEVNLFADRAELMRLENLPIDRAERQINEWTVVVLFIIGVLAVAIRHQNHALFSFLSTVRIGRIRNEEIDVEFNLDILISIVFVSLVSSYNYQMLSQMSSNGEIVSYWMLVFETLKLTFFLSLVLVTKYILISALARINALSIIIGTQFIDFIKFFSISGLVFFVILQLRFWLGYYADIQSFWVFENYYLLVYALFIFYFFFKLTQVTQYKKLHIISYLCTTEFVGVFLLALIIYK